MEKLDVLYTINNKYVDIMLVSILSIITNGEVSNLRIFIITSDFKLEDYKKVAKFLELFNIEFYFYDIREFNIEKYNLPEWHNTQVANARLFFQSILGNSLDDINNLLYLDADTLVVDNLSSLEEYSANAINAVKESMQRAHYIRTKTSPYFNSGVLYFNVCNWIDKNMEAKIVNYLQNPSIPLVFPDQDTLNFALSGEISRLPLNYNLLAVDRFLTGIYRKIYFDTFHLNTNSSEIENAIKKPIILHGTSLFEIKPWDSNIHPDYEQFKACLEIVDPKFTSEKLRKAQQFFASSPFLLKSLIIAHSFTPKFVQPMVRKLAVKVTKR